MTILKSDNRIREKYIDVLKGIAILLVILVHFEQNIPASNKWISRVAAIGARAPQLFFLVSAYLTWKTLDKHDINFRVFYKSRIRRLVPQYYIAIIISMLVPVISIKNYSIGNIIAHFLVLHGFYPLWINTILGVGWYVADLAIFYLFCPLLKKIINNIKESIVFLVISVVISSMILILYSSLSVEADKQGSYSMFFHTFCFFHQLPVMLLGIVLFYTIEKVKARDICLGKTIVFSALFIVILSIGFIFLHLNKRVLTSSFLFGVIFAWIFLVFYSIRDAFEKKCFIPIIILGKYSYGIYLFHYIIIDCFLMHLLSLIGNQRLLWSIFYVIIVVLSVGISYVFDMVEKKLIRARIKITAKV